jgi:hypothetical protein
VACEEVISVSKCFMFWYSFANRHISVTRVAWMFFTKTPRASPCNCETCLQIAACFTGRRCMRALSPEILYFRQNWLCVKRNLQIFSQVAHITKKNIYTHVQTSLKSTTLCNFSVWKEVAEYSFAENFFARVFVITTNFLPSLRVTMAVPSGFTIQAFRSQVTLHSKFVTLGVCYAIGVISNIHINDNRCSINHSLLGPAV